VGLNANVLAALRARIANPEGRADDQLLESVLRVAAIWRSRLLANTLIQLHGAEVQSGLFAGMKYLRTATEGGLLPRLVGSYESELHPHIQALADEGLDTVVDIGCAEGYYAVGLARLLPTIRVEAFDIDPAARKACAELAALNGVSDRVQVGGAFTPERFAAYEGTRTLVFMDIEGHEVSLLDPERAPALRTLKILVETHPGPTKLHEKIAARFADSHEIIQVEQAGKTTPLPPFLRGLGHLDQLIATWEWRRWPTPWLVMRPKSGAWE
jgi:SAM-dependent methyltransferase